MALAVEAADFAYHPDRPVFRGLSARFEPGRVVAVLGPNGCGKSTLLRLLLGARRPAAGAVTLHGRPVADLPPARLARVVAYIPQHSAPAFAFTAAQVVALGLHPFPETIRDGRVERALDAAGVADLAPRAYGTLSAGQQQRVTLARALAQLDAAAGDLQPPFLLADEPMSAMDPAVGLAAERVLRGLAGRGIGVVVVLHDLAAALRVADDALLLDARGGVVAAGPAGAVITPTALEACFGVAFSEGGARTYLPQPAPA